MKLKLKRRNVKKRYIRNGILLGNLVIVSMIVVFIIYTPKSNTQTPALLNDSSVQLNPLDQLSSADIALNVARIDNLPESTAVANQAQSAAADIATSTSNDNVLAKPQVVATTLKSKADITEYVSQTGDSVSSIAAKYGITSSSILWSNGLTADSLNPGTKLTIPPVNGIVYIVKAGDHSDNLAIRFKANADKITAYNDAEINGLTPGEQIIIPDAQLATSSGSASSASAIAHNSTSFPWGNGPVYGYNGYDYGYCTWFVASQIPVPSNWGNASSWSYYAGLSGWNVSSTPKVGAIAQTPYAAGGQGHVAIVSDVSPDGSQILIHDMNGLAGWGRVGTGWVATSRFVHYITP